MPSPPAADLLMMTSQMTIAAGGSPLDLPEELSAFHRRLSVLPPDTPVPYATLGRLWGAVSGWSGRKTIQRSPLL